MAPPSQPEDNKPIDYRRYPPYEIPPGEYEGMQLACFVKGAPRTWFSCGTCRGPITLGCEEAWHVAHCQAIGFMGKPCNRFYSTMFGCRRHPYRDGHNPEMRAYADSFRVGVPGPIVNPLIVALEREMEGKVVEKYKVVKWAPYKGGNHPKSEWSAPKEKCEAVLGLKSEEVRVAESDAKK